MDTTNPLFSDGTGYDEVTTTASLAKSILMQCEGSGDITLPKDTLKIILMALLQSWNGQQELTRSTFKKVAK